MRPDAHAATSVRRRALCACLLAPYFLVLVASLHAPRVPLPLPAWGKKGSLPLGRELSPSLRTLSCHLWPHPIWAALVALLFACLPSLSAALLLAELAGVPHLRAEHRAYLDRLGELPEHGFVPPTFGIVHGWRTFLYSLYLEFVARPDVRDLSPLASGGACFLPATLPPRAGARPSVPAGLPQRQTSQLASASVQPWRALLEDADADLRLTGPSDCRTVACSFAGGDGA